MGFPALISRSTKVTGRCPEKGIPLLQISSWLGFVELPAQCERFGLHFGRANPPLLTHVGKLGVQGRRCGPLQVPGITT